MKRIIEKLFLVALVVLSSVVCISCGGQDAHSAVIVIGEDANQDLAKQLQKAMGNSVKIVTDTEDTKAATEILLGETNREESLAGSRGIREEDGWVRFYEGSVVIQGGSKDKLEHMVQYFIENYVPIWKEGDYFSTEYNDNYYAYGKYALKALRFNDTDIYEYSIVTKNGEETADALLIQQHIEATSSYKLPIISSKDLEEGQKAIIFGSSDARNVKEKCVQLNEDEFLIEEEDGSLYLCAWSEEKENILAYMFLGETVGCQLYDDTVKESVVAYEDYRFKFTTSYDGSGKFNAMCTRVVHYPIQDEFNVKQGGCTDGTYIYIVMQDQIKNSGNCVIMKLDPSNWEVVDISEPLPLEHGNSITYVPELNRFLVANLEPDNTRVSWVDAKTLKFIKSENLPYTASSLSWSQVRKQFAVSSSNKIMLITDKDLNVKESYYGLASNYTNQGYAVDDEYIYIVSNSNNAIHVCDWEGHWIETISIPVGSEFEMETIIALGDMYYTTYVLNQDYGTDIYATIFYRRLYQ